MAYVDDVLVYSKTWKEHVEHLHLMFDMARERNITFSAKKCQFARRELEYVGWIVNREGHRPDPKKVEAICEFNLTKYSKINKVRSFLGTTSYLRKFIEGYATIVSPLRRLTTNDPTGKGGEKDDDDEEWGGEEEPP